MHRSFAYGLLLIIFSISFLLDLPLVADNPAPDASLSQVKGFLRQGQFEAARVLCDRILEKDPNNIEAIGYRGVAYAFSRKASPAREDLGRALAAQPNRAEWYFYRSQLHADMEQWWDSLADAETMLRLSPRDARGYLVRGLARAQTGDLDGGLEDVRLYLSAKPNDLEAIGAFAQIHKMMGLDAEALELFDRALGTALNKELMRVHRGVTLARLGRFAEAAEDARILEVELAHPVLGAFVRAYIHGLPHGGAFFDPPKSLQYARTASSRTFETRVWNALGLALTASERYDELLTFFDARVERADFETFLYLTNAHLHLGHELKARDYLQRAAELNPYAWRFLENLPELQELWKARGETARKTQLEASKLELGREIETHVLTVSQIESFHNRMRYAKAREEYSRYLGALKSPLRKEDLDRRLSQTVLLERLHGKLIDAVQSKKLKQSSIPYAGVKITLVDGDADRFTYKFAKGGGKAHWVTIDPPELLSLFKQLQLDAEDLLALGILATERGLPKEATESFTVALKRDPPIKGRVDEYVAFSRGIHVPEGGFVLYRGRFVTPEEKDNLSKGLVRFGQEWVTPADKKMLEKGLIKVAGKWLPKDEAELVRRGYRKWKGKWVSLEEYAAIRSQWENAYQEETVHYVVKTNASEELARELGAVLEVAYGELKKFYGAEPELKKGEKMAVYAYRSFEDYRKYCVENKATDHLNAAGFARSDSNVVVGYDKMQNTQMLLRTMVHEAAHLYYFRVRPWGRAPSWYAEGMASYFEGFQWRENRWQFDFQNATRVSFIKKALHEGKLIPWKEFFDAEAVYLINNDSEKALTFYAQAWSLLYYLKSTSTKAYQDRLAEFSNYVDKGTPKSLEEIFGPLYEKFRQDWEAFVQSL